MAADDAAADDAAAERAAPAAADGAAGRRTTPAADGAASPRRRHPLAVRVGLLVAAAFIILDQATKELAEALLVSGQPPVPWLSDGIGWQLIYNAGGAFGLPAPPWLFLIVTVVVTWIVLRNLPQTSSLLAATAYGMLLAGALGNIIDRLFRPGAVDGWPIGSGYVVDFVAWGTFPRFNVADSAITVGFVLLVIAMWLEERQAVRAEADIADPPPTRNRPVHENDESDA